MDFKVMMMVLGVIGGVGARPPLSSTSLLPNHLDPKTCPPTYEDHPLLLISMDGFRADYLNRGVTPTISALSEKGVNAPYMKPSFPTITFPNHYTLVTGLYPASHGIVANSMYDPKLESGFRAGHEEFFKKRWWGGEPIWTTVQKKGKKSATFFWPGSEVEGQYPDYWYYYNESVPFTNRVDQVLNWLDKPSDLRPSFITLYFHEPDATGHDFGPYSHQIELKLAEMDQEITHLIEGLKVRSLLPCVNIFIVADHGMEEAGMSRLINLSDYDPNLAENVRFFGGGVARMTPHHSTPESKEEIMRSVVCKREELRIYERELLPTRWHLGAQDRMEDVIVEVDAGFTVESDSFSLPEEGEHGYDEHFPSMSALFLAYGPDLAQKKNVEVFQNIELYNLMCHLLGVEPAPNNGTWGALHHLLASPPPPPQSERKAPRKMIKAVPEAVESNVVALSISKCEGDVEGSMEWLNVLKKAQKEKEFLVPELSPFGSPRGFEDETKLLLQPDSLTAYSTNVRLPLWSSFGVRRMKEWTEEWRSDPRLNIDDSPPSCSSYSSVKGLNITRHPLFPPEYRCDGCDNLPFLITNSLPLTTQLVQEWRALVNRTSNWSNYFGPINVVAGPVLDYNADSLADKMDQINGSELVVPTHVFMVVSRCIKNVSSLTQCPHHLIDVHAFILPQYIPVTNCMSSEKFLQEYSAKVSDVESATGLTFFPDLDYYDRVRLRTRIHSNIWGHQEYGHRLLDHLLYP